MPLILHKPRLGEELCANRTKFFVSAKALDISFDITFVFHYSLSSRPRCAIRKRRLATKEQDGVQDEILPPTQKQLQPYVQNKFEKMKVICLLSTISICQFKFNIIYRCRHRIEKKWTRKKAESVSYVEFLDLWHY